MFTNKKVKSILAVICAMTSIVINVSTVIAQPANSLDVDAIRTKALGEYLSSSAGILKRGLSLSQVIDNTHRSESLPLYQEVVAYEPANFNTVKKLNPALETGETKTIREGVPGTKRVVYRVKYVGGAEVSRTTVIEVVTVAPIDKIVEYGDKTQVTPAPAPAPAPKPAPAPASTQTPEPANGPIDPNTLNYKYVLTCEATAYDISPEQNGGYGGMSATGVPLGKGVIAVDPKVIPLGSRVYIEALDGSWVYGYAVAADTGGAIKGNKVDLCYLTNAECIQFGRRKCRVYVLN